MGQDHEKKVYLADSMIRLPGPPGDGEWVELDGERFCRIANHHALPPFLVSVVSGYDHWLFIS